MKKLTGSSSVETAAKDIKGTHLSVIYLAHPIACAAICTCKCMQASNSLDLEHECVCHIQYINYNVNVGYRL